MRSEDEWNEYFDSLHLRKCRCFAVAVVVLNLREENGEQSNVNEDAICLKLVEELPDALKEMTWMPVVYNACAIFGLFGEDDEDDCCCDEDFFEVECPNCGAELDIDESILEAGTVECPGCGSKFAIDLTDDEDECCCGHHHGHCHDEAGESSEEK